MYYTQYCIVSSIIYTGPFQPFAKEIEEIEYTEIEGHLIAEGLLSKNQQQTLFNINNTESYKRRYFRDIVLDYNLENCKKLLKCLKDTDTLSVHDQLYRKLSPVLKGT